VSGRFEYQTTWAAAVPATLQASGSVHVIANVFNFAVDGFIVGVRFYRHSTNGGEHVGIVLDETDNSLLGVTRFKYNAAGVASAWQHAYLRPRVPVVANHNYYVGVSCSDRLYRYTGNGIPLAGLTVGDITSPADSALLWNGQFSSVIGRNGWTHAARTRYGVDPLFLRGDLN
jgi:Domain of unknown function (DUF4082)